MGRNQSLSAARTPAQRLRVLHIREARKHRAAVFERDNWTCVYCGDTRRPRRLDHDIPISRGGSSTPGNLACACDLCDKMKGDMTGEEFRRLPRSIHPVRGKKRP